MPVHAGAPQASKRCRHGRLRRRASLSASTGDTAKLPCVHNLREEPVGVVRELDEGRTCPCRAVRLAPRPTIWENWMSLAVGRPQEDGLDIRDVGTVGEHRDVDQGHRACGDEGGKLSERLLSLLCGELTV